MPWFHLYFVYHIIFYNYSHHYNQKKWRRYCFYYLRHFSLHLWYIYSIFFQLLLQIYSILKICYDILRYSAIPFLWRKMSIKLDFKRTFQYFQVFYSVVRISSQLFHYDNDNNCHCLYSRYWTILFTIITPLIHPAWLKLLLPASIHLLIPYGNRIHSNHCIYLMCPSCNQIRLFSVWLTVSEISFAISFPSFHWMDHIADCPPLYCFR